MKAGRIAVVAALSLAGMAAALTGPARASASAGPDVISATISPAAQAAALAYWTPARMAAATSLGSSTPAVTSRSFSGLRSVGALFYTTGGGKTHFCTASIIKSAPRNILLTAAHCVYHDGAFVQNVAFVPDYHAGKRPYGTYPVEAAFVTSGWWEHAEISQDFSFLVVTSAVQSRVGAALTLGINQAVSRKIAVVSYNDTAGNPIWCSTRSYQPKGLPSQMEFQCDGFADGTSGSPWIEGGSLNADGTVFGDIGGYEQGGNSPNWSYSPKFTSVTKNLYDLAAGV